ncbi:protein lifeguard 1 isoform X1 [Manduca sexta]|uniref:protein lifeguard 1 isoform X1 n=1 Tax=Manduca sexta TaxID=7130 RepID=UPI00189084EC|nr:protein lifeguard 1 isoform X1 [Manduca sexta]
MKKVLGLGRGIIETPAGYSPNVGVGEDGEVKGFDFTEQSIRKAFIRKVYSILMCQLLVTMGFIALFLFHGPTKAWAARNPWMFWVAFAVVFVCLIAMACCDGVRRQAPMNFIFLAIFTVAESFLLGVTSSVYDVSAVMMAVGITAGVCLALTIFAFQTRWDFTTMGGVLLCATVVLLLFGIIAIFIPRNNIVTLVYASLGALIFSMYLVYDTQLMMGGKHKYSISPEEYIFAALNLYLDIINIFLYILTIIGVARD